MRTSRKVINLYDDKDIFSIKHVISINNEEDLNQFWDFLTTTQDSSHKYLHTFVSNFYNFALSYIDQDDAQFFEIILEENDKKFYFTLWNEKISLLFKKYLYKTSIEYIHKDSRISIKLVKKSYTKKLKKISKENKKREENLILSVAEEKTVKIIPPYTFIEQEDLQDLIQLSDDLQEIVYQINKVGISEEQFIKLRSTFSLFCFTLRYYEEVEPIMVTINDFLNLMNTNKEKFILLQALEFELIYGFINNIERWINTLFITGGAELNFMNNSIQSDYMTISQIIIPTSEEELLDLDDIFDF